MKTFLVSIILIINLGKTKAQLILVPNFSFEDSINCNSLGYYIEENVYNWRGGRGYFNPCKMPLFSVPNNEFGSQNAKSGNSYCGLFSYGKSLDFKPFRNYIQVKLLNKLIAEKKYNVEFYVSASNLMHAKSNSIGAYFSVDSFSVSNIGYDNLLPFVPQIQNNPDNDLSDTANWTLVSGNFIANGGEQYLTIGNFLPDSLSNVIPLDSVCSDPNGFGCGVYFYIDDVSLVLDDDSGTEESLLSNNFKVFTNPSKDVLKIEMQTNFNGTIQIRDALGKEIFNTNFQNNISNFTIDTKDFESGLYFISFRNERGEVNKKFVKQ
jgi:hypothetical protein